MAMSTRPFRLPDDEHITKFSREALEDMLRQAQSTFLPATLEHLPFLPPIARWNAGAIVDAADGAAELILEGADLQQLVRIGPDPTPLDSVDALPLASRGLHPQEVELDYEPRNYKHEDAKAFRDEAPISLGKSAAWSALPPIEWVVSIVVLWPAVRFVGAFLDELGHASGKAVVEWIHSASKRAHASERARLFTIRFTLDEGRYVSAIIPFDAKTKPAEMIAALESANSIASFAAVLKQGKTGLYDSWVRGTFIFDAGTWNFGWWTDGERVYRTRWFEENCPDPARFLGRPLSSLDLDGKSLSGGGEVRQAEDETPESTADEPAD
jgi:hypothetical protein